MVESEKKLRKRKEHEEREVEGLIGSDDQGHSTKKRRLESAAVSENEHALEQRKREKQERKEARAEKRRLEALRRNKSEEGHIGHSGSSEGIIGKGQAFSTTKATDRESSEDVERRKNDQKRSPPPAQLLPVPAHTKASETGTVIQNPKKSKQRLSSKARIGSSQETPLSMKKQNAEASSSSASQDVSVPKQESKEAKQKRIDAMSHEELLSSVWLNAAQLREKVETEGMVVKTGIFSTTEKAQIQKFLSKYKAMRHLTEQQLADMINANGKKARSQFGGFWNEVAASVPGRPLRTVHAHLKRAYEPGSRKGAWTLAEDEELRSAYMEFGPQWKNVAMRVDRASQDCKDRWRNYVSHQDTRVSGAWSAEESDRLKRSVIELGTLFGKSLEDTANGIQWSVIANKMNNTRSPAQCRIKWTDDILPGIVSNKKMKWKGTDTVQMVKRILLQNPRDRSEVDWNALPYPEWNHMSGHKCLKNFGKMVHKIPGAQDMEFRVLLDVLLKEGRRTEKDRVARSLARQEKTLQQANEATAAMVAAELATQSRYKSKEFVIDSDPDATDNET